MMVIVLKARYSQAGPVYLLIILPLILLVGLLRTDSIVWNIQQTTGFAQQSRSLVVVKKADVTEERGNTILATPSKRVETTEPKTTNESTNETSIDIISVGSITKPDYHEAQEHTFGAHSSIRNFFKVTELNDTDATCHTNFTMDQVMQVISFCNSTEGQTTESTLLRKRLYWPKRHSVSQCFKSLLIFPITLDAF